ncbi:MAG: DUF4197 domain-containing protein [Desulfobacterales bacterium]|nr:DUF4197 domain-containing protein [Desulfobacterales bacterium]
MRSGGLIFFVLWVGIWAITPLPAYSQFENILKTFKKASGNSELTENNVVQGLKDALQIATDSAVESVAQVGGYYQNPDIQIPLPGPVQKMEKVLRATGFGSQVDAFKLSMNQAAEQAAPQAKSLFWDAIKLMTFSDARTILNGGDHAATTYFKDKTFNRLQEIFKPIVHNKMSEVGVTRTFQTIDEAIGKIPFADPLTFDLDQYVTHSSLEGLFFMIAQEEKKIRQDPATRVTDLLKKVFGDN